MATAARLQALVLGRDTRAKHDSQLADWCDKGLKFHPRGGIYHPPFGTIGQDPRTNLDSTGWRRDVSDEWGVSHAACSYYETVRIRHVKLMQLTRLTIFDIP